MTWLCFLLTAGASQPSYLHAQNDQPVYRIVFSENVAQLQDAQRLESMLRDLGYSPLFVEPQGEGFRVLYGHFLTERQANEAMRRLEAEGLLPQGITQVRQSVFAPTTSSAASHTILIRFIDRERAAEAVRRLEASGFSPVSMATVSGQYLVQVGRYTYRDGITNLGRIKGMDYATAELRRLSEQGEALPPRPISETRPPEDSIESVIADRLASSEDFADLSDEQKDQLVKSIVLTQNLRAGNELAPQVIDMDKRLQSLGEEVEGLLHQVEAEADEARQIKEQIEELVVQAKRHQAAEEWAEAIQIYQRIRDEVDPQDKLRYRLYIDDQIAWLRGRQSGELIPGQQAETRRQVELLKERALRLAGSADQESLIQAAVLWNQIWSMSPADRQTAEDALGSINASLANIRTQNQELMASTVNKRLQTLTMAGGAALAALLALLAFVWLRGRSQHKELMRKVQEITSIRPMRELDSGGGGLLDSGGGTATESEIFSPRSPAAAAGPASLDPLGGVEDAPSAGGGSADDDIFGDLSGGLPSAAPANNAAGGATTGVDDMNLDDIFGDVGGAAPEATQRIQAPDTAQSQPGGDLDDVFGDIFSAEETSPAVAPGVPETPPPPPQSDTSQPGPISFGDFEFESPGASAEETAAGQSQDDELLSIFDDAIDSATGDETSPSFEPDQGGAEEEAPFAGGLGSNPFTGAPQAVPTDEDNEIPALRLDGGAADDTRDGETSVNFTGFDAPSPENDETNVPIGTMPDFSFDDLSGATAALGQAPGADLDFENDDLGATPLDWTGNHPAAALTVECESPPRGSHQYLRYEKTEGAAVTPFMHRFGEVGGQVEIEFDLRCNSKNKFLLGFFVEKDGDPRSAIHTKILRSETQTTPTIHMQGEPAPYLLGSWAHIRYVVDLDNGTLNGYIDGTHVARNVTLENNPGSLNTLTIRDNTSTTGVLLLDNIRVQPIS
ncbi:MAG TPA: SPOR domain-containing protein [Candidatus Sumerlaeota bacterium]|nr:SPOR domain-containing protein [Candidatus Sumerlaeota bacterium]